MRDDGAILNFSVHSVEKLNMPIHLDEWCCYNYQSLSNIQDFLKSCFQEYHDCWNEDLNFVSRDGVLGSSQPARKLNGRKI